MMRGSAFFLQFCIFLVYRIKNMHTFHQLGEKYAYFLPIGEKICVFPPFFIPFQYFFSPNLLFGHIFAPHPRGNKPQTTIEKYSLKMRFQHFLNIYKKNMYFSDNFRFFLVKKKLFCSFFRKALIYLLKG